jgi:hypothetical protein
MISPVLFVRENEKGRDWESRPLGLCALLGFSLDQDARMPPRPLSETNNGKQS